MSKDKGPDRESILISRMEELIRKYTILHDDLTLYIKVNQILVGLFTGIKPGQKGLDDLQIIKLRNQGVRVKDIAMIQGISECAMSRKIKHLKEEGLLDV